MRLKYFRRWIFALMIPLIPQPSKVLTNLISFSQSPPLKPQETYELICLFQFPWKIENNCHVQQFHLKTEAFRVIFQWRLLWYSNRNSIGAKQAASKQTSIINYDVTAPDAALDTTWLLPSRRRCPIWRGFSFFVDLRIRPDWRSDGWCGGGMEEIGWMLVLPPTDPNDSDDHATLYISSAVFFSSTPPPRESIPKLCLPQRQLSFVPFYLAFHVFRPYLT